MDQARVATVISMATEAGVPADAFSGWEGHEFGLYRDRAARSRTLEAAKRTLDGKLAEDTWVLDLGVRAVSLPEAQARLLQSSLDRAGVTYKTGSVLPAYLERVHRVTRDHGDILRKLATR
jgi:hypothetical protein